MRSKKFDNLAYLKTMAVRRTQNYGTRRLLREVKQLETNPIPTVNVAALPQKNNVYAWKILLSGPKESIYEGLYLRVNLTLPPNYPLEPPLSITLEGADKIPHPFIFGNVICIECFQKNKDQEKGWNSLYTLESIFLQLQNFLWEGHEKFKDHKKNKKLIKELVKKNEEFKFGDEKAGWPAAIPQDDFKEEEFFNKSSELELYRNSLTCFHTKRFFEEGPLGYGIKVTRVARTGEVKQGSSVNDLLSLRGFIKYGIRRSPAGETFGYWIPAYLGIDTKERTLHLAKKSLSFIMTNNTNRFEPLHAPKVLLKALFSSILKMVDQKTRPNINVIRQIVHFHGLLLLLAREYPEITEYMDEMIRTFITDKESRTKKHTPNLGQVLLCCLFSKEYTINDIIEAYFEEQLDRQVFWILNKIPELEDDSNTMVIDTNRVEVTFTSQIVSYRLTMFYHDYNKILRSQFKDWTSMLEYLEENGCKLSTDVEMKILDTFKECISGVKNYDQYFERLGLPHKNQDQLTGMLKQAVKNSKEKKYHGEVDEVIGLPEEIDQIKHYLSRTKNLLDYIEDGKLVEKSDEDWQKLCFERWPWMKNFFNADYERKTSPKDLAIEHENRDKTGFIEQSDSQEIYQTVFSNKTRIGKSPSEYYADGVKDYDDDFSWKQLYAKIDIEESVMTLYLHNDFKAIYRRLDAAADLITNFTLYITKCTNLKSGYYFLCSVLSFFKNIKVLTLKAKGIASTIPYKAIVNLKKGFSKMNTDEGSKLLKLRVRGCQFDNQNKSAEAILEIFDNLPNLLSLDLETTNLLDLKERKLSNLIIVSHPNIKELRIVSSAQHDDVAKGIADGLMRAKKLEYLEFRNNYSPKGITNLLYNLAFAPKLSVLDLSGSSIGDYKDFVENLQKLISISGSIEYISVANLSIYSHLQLDMFKAIGENTSLKYLDLTNTNSSNQTHTISHLAHSISINAKKLGQLEEIYLGGVLSGYNAYQTFVDNLWTSPYFEETWYGDSYKAEKMGGTDRDREYICNLKTLVIDKANMACGHFSYEKYTKKINMVLPEWLYLFSICDKLTVLSLERCGLGQYHFESLRAYLEHGFYSATYDRNKQNQSKLFHLNLRHNGIYKGGAEHLKHALKVLSDIEILQLDHCHLGVAGGIHINEVIAANTKLKILNLSANKIEVDGARNMGAALEKNTNLQFLDIAYNKIRDEGLRVVGESLAKNEKTSITCLGVRHNLLSDSALEKLIQNISKNKSLKLNSLLFRGNNVTDYHLNSHIKLIRDYSENLFVDIISKEYYLEEDRMNRTIWVDHNGSSADAIKKYFKQKEVGIIINIRLRVGKKYQTIPNHKAFFVVEFAHPLSVEKALILVSKRENFINGSKTMFHRAGSSTFYYNKDCKSSKYMANKGPAPVSRGGRRAGGRGGRGRGRR